MLDLYSMLQDGESIDRFLRRSAESGYRPYPCPECGGHRASVCNDGMLRCEKCSLERRAGAQDLAEVFGTVAGYGSFVQKATSKD